MPQNTLDVKDRSNADKTIFTPNANGRANAVDSAPVVLSNEDLATLASGPVSRVATSALLNVNDSVTVAVGDLGGLAIYIPAFTSGTIVFEAQSASGAPVESTAMAPIGGDLVSFISGPWAGGTFEGTAGGFIFVRARVSVALNTTINAAALVTNWARVLRVWSRNAKNFLVMMNGSDDGGVTARILKTENDGMLYLGSDGGTAPTQPSGGTGIRGWLSGAVKTLLAISLQLPTALGLGTAASSLRTVAANDQQAIQTVQPMVVVPIANNILSSTGSAQAQVIPGGLYTFCIAVDNAVLGATANTVASCTTTSGSAVVATANTANVQVGTLLAGAGIVPGSYVVSINAGVSFTMNLPANASGTITVNITAGAFAGNFQSSPDGTTWTNVNVTPKTYAIASAQTNSFVAPGLWQYAAGSTEKFLRFNLTSINSTGSGSNLTTFQLRFDIDAFDRNGSIVNLPFVSYVAATAATFPTGIPTLMPIDMMGMGYASIGVQTLSGTSQSYTWRQSADPTGARFLGLSHLTNQQAQAASALTITASGEFILPASSRYLSASMTGGTAVTANTITGCVGHVGAMIPATLALNTINNQPINIAQIVAGTPNVAAPGGATNKSLGVYIGGCVPFTAYSAQAWAAASGSGAVIADTNGGGLSYSFDINVTAWTVGSSTGLVVVVEDSTDSGTTYVTRWMSEPMTGVSHVNIPAIPIMGRCRMRWFHISGSATTATVTVVAQALSFVLPKHNQYFDRTASVGSGTAVVSTNSAAYDISGLKGISVVLDAGTATVMGSFKVQMSQDGLKWYDASAAVATAATTANMTPIPITSGVYGRFIRVTCTNAGTSQLMNSINIYGTN